MPLSCYVPSQIIPKSRVVHLADKQILKRHILSYPKITVSKNPRGRGVGVGWGGGSIPGPWTTHTHRHTQDVGRPNPATESFKRRTDAGINFRIRHLILGFTKLEFLNVALMVKTFFFSRSPSSADSLTVSVQHSPPPPSPPSVQSRMLQHLCAG